MLSPVALFRYQAAPVGAQAVTVGVESLRQGSVRRTCSYAGGRRTGDGGPQQVLLAPQRRRSDCVAAIVQAAGRGDDDGWSMVAPRWQVRSMADRRRPVGDRSRVL